MNIIGQDNSIQNILLKRIEEYKNNPALSNKQKSTEYQKQWAKGVQFFQIEINKERKKDKMPEVSFIAVRQKLLALKEIDDLRWFYYHCKKYANTKDKQGNKNSFSKCFFGSLKCK